jgi:lipopolysaccharide/colanic/teichoic acid biosynthesis glycosyltransferase
MSDASALASHALSYAGAEAQGASPGALIGAGVEGSFARQHMVLGERVRAQGLGRSARLLKRVFDLVGATLMLLVFAPLMIVVALLIRLEDRGPVLFSQTRVGRDGRPFEIFKFRTMVVGADELKEQLRSRSQAGGLFKIADDPRVTRVGSFVRRSCIDELPQLFNVLGGKMSLVGPRPLIPEEDRLIVGWQRARLHAAPGMTGHWQVLGGARVPLQEMVVIDCHYVGSWTLWSDVKTLAKTVPCVLAMRGM